MRGCALSALAKEVEIMKYNHLGGCRTIDEYVRRKLEALNRTDRTFADFFEFMFSEKEAVLYERSVGYKIV